MIHLHGTHHHNDSVLGLIIGALLGVVKGFMNVVGVITMDVVIETSLLAGIGAFVGFLVTTVSKWAFDKISNRKKTKKKKL